MILTDGEDVVDVQSWPGEGVVLGVALLMGTAASLQHSLGHFYFISEVAAAAGNALKGGREHHKCDENVNNQGKRERKCEVAL